MPFSLYLFRNRCQKTILCFLISVSESFFFLFMVGTSGLEPPTSRLSGVRSNHLSYAPSLVEMRRIELLTPCLQSRCSPSWATPPRLCLEPLVLNFFRSSTNGSVTLLHIVSFAFHIQSGYPFFKILKFPSESSKLNNDFFHSPCWLEDISFCWKIISP